MCVGVSAAVALAADAEMVAEKVAPLRPRGPRVRIHHTPGGSGPGWARCDR